MDEAVDRTGREILVDEPDWKDVLRVVPIEVTRARSRLTEFANRLHVRGRRWRNAALSTQRTGERRASQES